MLEGMTSGIRNRKVRGVTLDLGLLFGISFILCLLVHHLIALG